MGPGGLSPSSCARSQRCRRVIPAGYRGSAVAGESPGPPGEPGESGEPRVLTGAGSVFPAEVEAPQHFQERRVRGALRGGAGTVPHLHLHLVLDLVLVILVFFVLFVLEPARGPPRAPPPQPPREGVGDAPGLLHGPARHGAGTAPPIPGTGRDPPLPGTSGREGPAPARGRKRRGWAGERATGTLGHCHRRGGPGHRPPGHPPSVPGCCRPPVVPATSLTVTPAAVPVNPSALLPPSRCSLFPWHCHPCQ